MKRKPSRLGRPAKNNEKKLTNAEELVSIAYKEEDNLSGLIELKTFNHNGLVANVECRSISNLSSSLLEWALRLTRKNMQPLYEESDWGWNEIAKHKEMTDKSARYLITFDSKVGDPLGFAHFRFELERADPVLYCYEIQLEDRVRRFGLGKFLMNILEHIASRAKMKKVMLTVFKHNNAARSFFETTMRFQLDGTDPSLFNQKRSYLILSKKTSLADNNEIPLPTS